jgi:hypothetical protein
MVPAPPVVQHCGVATLWFFNIVKVQLVGLPQFCTLVLWGLSVVGLPQTDSLIL